ncbi:dipeptidase [Jiangella sp. DSM 45060]|uniref:dipeptidase n=1 Tax=Jiangella sp. DSM 45060 TaxID=1798224 RepID=UPI00087C925F|nr:membrane dipeptidase [Jiangella sp. DSM 45060]SDS44942.1 membrane dipeptidase [Jiangella sp. DSM 45060]
MIYVDGLENSIYDRQVFQELRTGRITCAVVTMAFWEDTLETMDRIGQWHDFAEQNADLIVLARTTSDIEHAAATDRTAIMLGTQNSSPIADRVRFVELFHDMGLRVMQLTYNNQNALGGSCYEPRDSGLTRFGAQVVKEMNRVGMLVDISHVGERTGLEAAELSEKPIAITHANASSLVPHKRNKGDDLIRAVAERGGIIGIPTYPKICGEYYSASLERWCELILRTVELAGIDHVGIGTDIGRNEDQAYLDWMRVGRWTKGEFYGAGSAASPGVTPPPDFMKTTEGFPAVEAELRRHLPEADVAKVMGGNWIRVYRDVIDPS